MIKLGKGYASEIISYLSSREMGESKMFRRMKTAHVFRVVVV